MSRDRRPGSAPLSKPRVWAVPAGLAFFSLLGLLAALFGNGAADAISWFALGTPVAVTAWHLVKAGTRR